MLFDIGCNLLDPMYEGVYRGKKRHEGDLDLVLQRGWDAGVGGVMITAGNAEEAARALDMSKRDERLYSTVGVHPTRCDAFESSENYMDTLVQLAETGKRDGKVVAVGELGLDYDRLHFCSKETQLKWFERQLVDLAAPLKLPLFLHSRAADEDMFRLLRKHEVTNGVVHSFTGSMEEMEMLVDLGLHIGINGCSLKTEVNLKVAAAVPENRLLLETDGPWCDMRRTHASFEHIKTHFESKKEKKFERGLCVKNRTETCHMVQVLECVASIRGAEPAQLEKIVWDNTQNLFF